MALMNTKRMYRLVALAAVIAIGYAIFAYVPWARNDAAAAPEQKHPAHAMTEVDATKPIPTVAVEAIRDSKDGYNLHVTTTNFSFTPEDVGGAPQANTGHVHLYVNGVKVARLYGEWFNLGNAQLKGGENVIEVTLNANDHSEWTVSGEHIAAKITITK